MKIAFSGASGSGKSTLTNWVSKEFGIPHVSGSSGDLKIDSDKKYLFDKYGFNGSSGHLNVIQESHKNPEFGYELQCLIQERRSEMIRDHDHFVTDRSPLDNWVYFLLQSALYQTDEVVEEFMNRCISAMAGLDYAIYIPSVIPIENNCSRVPILHYQRAVDCIFERYWLIFEMKLRSMGAKIVMSKVVSRDLSTRKEIVGKLLKHEQIN